MKSVLLFVLSALSIVRSDGLNGYLYVHHDGIDYVACDLTPVAYQTYYVYIFFLGPYRIGSSNICLVPRIGITLHTDRNDKRLGVPPRCLVFIKPRTQIYGDHCGSRIFRTGRWQRSNIEGFSGIQSGMEWGGPCRHRLGGRKSCNTR
jgi:hypothetical protein